MTILWTSKIMHITSIAVFDCWAGAASEKEVQSKSNNLFSSGVNQNSHLIPFLILLSQTYLLSIHLIYCIWSGNGAKEDPPWNCNRWLEIMKWQKRAERRKQLWKKKDIYRLILDKTTKFDGRSVNVGTSWNRSHPHLPSIKQLYQSN